ncbi:zf-4CXXC_R1 domain-containing protein [Cephalotus follicularis]|uniref:Zf-4CXXC_R1 domain-containing protein n=1 Tax=Cephalotus follicularis TaxID=3775 RepID=A0A1Q3C624_CEPFO|nr:zf-4CXXC_R1 domain-containing protein [Cephalotus follicularis]
MGFQMSDSKEEEREKMKESVVCGGGDKEKGGKSPRVRVVGGRIYDSQNGKTCHQCRQKTRDFSAACTNLKQNKQCTIRFCHKCLLNRYGEKAEDVALLDDWNCPKCRGICNCSFCMKKRGHRPTGMLVYTAKATGFSSVSEMLNVRGFENDGLAVDLGGLPNKLVASKKQDLVAASPRKPGKENSFDGKCDVKLNSQDLTPISIEKKSKKRKREGLKELSNRNTEDNGEILTKDVGAPKKPNTSEDISEKEVKKREKDGDGGAKKKKSKTNDSVLEEEMDSTNSNAGVFNGIKSDNARVKLKAPIESCIVKKCSVKPQTLELHAAVQLPMGTLLSSIAGFELRPKDVGDALQFLEFCAAFAEVLDLKEGQAESVVKELICGRSRRRAQYSSLVQFHIQLLSLIHKDMGEECTSLSPTSGKNSWLQTLKKCISESHHVLEDSPFNCFARGGDGYDNLDTSKKLKLLNFLCDEALCTTGLRKWIDGQKSKFSEREKEAKERVNAAKDKEKQLKQKLQDEVAKAIIVKNDAPLSVAEHEAVISQIKIEASKAHAEMVEATGMVPKKRQRSDAVRTDPLLLDVNGRAFWRLKCHTREPDVLLQDMETWNAVVPNEKWFAYNAEQKQDIEKYISSLRTKRLRAPKVANSIVIGGCEIPL